MQEVAQATGICLDPVYSGKALHAMLAEIKGNPQAWAGRKWVPRSMNTCLHIMPSIRVCWASGMLLCCCFKATRPAASAGYCLCTRVA